MEFRGVADCCSKGFYCEVEQQTEQGVALVHSLSYCIGGAKDTVDDDCYGSVLVQCLNCVDE